MKIICSDGPNRFLADLEYESDGKPMGQVFDTRRGVQYPPRLLPSLLTRGDWEDCTVTEEEMRVIVLATEPISPPE